jgi:tripartite ATP-independent transporter DctP family solute receptor
MRGPRTQWLILGMAIAWVVFGTACTQENRSILFRYSNEQPLSAVRSQSMLFFKEQLEARTGGRIRVELYFGGVLGTERELMDFLAMGVLQGTRGGYFADANPEFKLFTLPFLVDDWDQAMRLMRSDFTSGINRNAQGRGFHIPATGISQGFRAHTNSRHPIRHPDDLKGMKMRVPSQEVYVQTARAFGANPQELPSIEIYQALQTGVVDGQDNPPSNIWDYKIHEVSKYLTITHYSTGPDPFMVNLKWYQKLPGDLQQTFDEVARETMAWSDQRSREREQEYLVKLGETLEINYLTGAELIPFQAAVRPVYQHFVDQGDFDWDDIETARKIARENPGSQGDP